MTDTPPRRRLIGPDVTRGLALVGVVVMNYHGYLNGVDAIAGPDATLVQSVFDPWEGVLSTRFAAAFVLVAGIGITLLTNRSRLGDDRQAVRDDRWRLARRGLALYAGGFVLNWIWSGTILFFYGAFFLVGALLFRLRSSVVLAIGVVSGLAAAGIQWWAAVRARDGHSVAWLLSPETLGTRSPRGLWFDTFVNGTHPLLPWLAFLCTGIVLGRHLGDLVGRRRAILAAASLAVTAVTYLVNHLGTSGLDRSRPGDLVQITLLSTHPFDRGLLYTLGTLGTAIAAFCLVSIVAERFEGTTPITLLAATGRTTLTLYVLHVLVFNGVVDWWGWVGSTGLDTALAFALVFWVLAMMFANWWQRFIGMGPLERLYRGFGG